MAKVSVDALARRLDELEVEQEQTTENMVEMHDQVMRMIKIAEELKVETAIVAKLSKAVDSERIKDVIAEFLKERAAKRLNTFFLTVGYGATILAGAAILVAIARAVFG